MSALGVIHQLYRGGEVHVALSNPQRSNQRQGRIWNIAKLFGTAVAEEARTRHLRVNDLSVWKANLLLGLVSSESCYWVFCNWPGNPKIYTTNLDSPDPSSVDTLLSAIKIPYADAVYAFRLPLEALDSSEDASPSKIDGLVSEYFDYAFGVRYREGDEPAKYSQLLSMMMGKSGPDKQPVDEVGWRVRLNASQSTSELLEQVMTSRGLRVRRQGKCVYLYSADFEQYSDTVDVLNHANQLLHLASALVILWAGEPGEIRAENAELVHADGSVEGLMASAPITASIWSRGGKAALGISAFGFPSLTLADVIIGLAHSDETARRVLKLTAQTDRSWADLYTILEAIRQDIGGDQEFSRRKWCTIAEVDRFNQTANTAEFGRHARDWKPPKKPMSLPEAQRFVQQIVRAWLSSKVTTKELAPGR
jgi:hypothetical protein